MPKNYREEFSKNANEFDGLMDELLNEIDQLRKEIDLAKNLIHSDIELIKILIERNGKSTAPNTTQRHGVHYQTIIAIGNDNCAFITLTDDSIKALEK